MKGLKSRLLTDLIRLVGASPSGIGYSLARAEVKAKDSKNPGPEDPALVIPRGDLLCWDFNGLWSGGVME